MKDKKDIAGKSTTVNVLWCLWCDCILILWWTFAC